MLTKLKQAAECSRISDAGWQESGGVSQIWCLLEGAGEGFWSSVLTAAGEGKAGLLTRAVPKEFGRAWCLMSAVCGVGAGCKTSSHLRQVSLIPGIIIFSPSVIGGVYLLGELRRQMIWKAYFFLNR